MCMYRLHNKNLMQVYRPRSAIACCHCNEMIVLSSIPDHFHICTIRNQPSPQQVNPTQTTPREDSGDISISDPLAVADNVEVIATSRSEEDSVVIGSDHSSQELISSPSVDSQPLLDTHGVYMLYKPSYIINTEVYSVPDPLVASRNDNNMETEEPISESLQLVRN